MPEVIELMLEEQDEAEGQDTVEDGDGEEVVIPEWCYDMEVLAHL